MPRPVLESESPHLPTLLKSSILAAAYYAAGTLSLSLDLVSSAEVLIWPPLGIGLAALLLYGLRLWPGIVAGSFLLSIRAGIPLMGALGAALAIAGESLLSAYLLRHRMRIHNSLARIRDVLALFALAGVVGPATGSLAGASSYCLAGLFPWSEFGKIWLLWWEAGAMAALVVAPAFLTWGSNLHLRWTRPKGVEALVLASWILFGNLLVFSPWSLIAKLHFPFAALPYGLRIWAALRFGLRGVTTANMLVVLIAARGTWGGFGPLVGQTALQSVLYLAAYGISTSAVGMLLAAVICEREQVAEELRTSEDRYRDLVEHIEDLICTHDLEGRILSVNRTPARILGYEPSELLNKSIRDFLAPEVQVQFGEYLASVQRDGFAKGLMLVLTKTGERRIWEYHNTLRKERVASPIVRGMAHDITERMRIEKARREIEKQYRIVVETASDAIISTDENSKILFVNAATTGMFGYQSAELIGQPLTMLMPPFLRERYKAGVQRYLATRQRHINWQETQMIGLRKNGEEFPVEVSIGEIRKEGHPIFTAFLRNITERKRAEEELRRLSGSLLRSQDEERRRIARDLHDTTGQDFVALSTTLGQLHGSIPSSNRKSRKLISQCQALAERCIRQVRTLSYLLHPPCWMRPDWRMPFATTQGASPSEAESRWNWKCPHASDGWIERSSWLYSGWCRRAL